MLDPKYPRPLFFPLYRQSAGVPLVVLRNGREQGDRQRMVVQLFQDVIDLIGPFAVLVYPVECILRSLRRQCGDADGLAKRRDCGDS